MADICRNDGTQLLSPKSKKRHINRTYYAQEKENIKKRTRSMHFNIQVKNDDSCRLENIKKKIATVKSHLGPSVDNAELMNTLLDSWLDSKQLNNPNILCQTGPECGGINSTEDIDMFMASAPIPPGTLKLKTQLHSHCIENDQIYLVCDTALRRLFSFFIESEGKCSCGAKFDLSSLKPARVTTNNHCVKVSLQCKNKHILEWFSSPIITSQSTGRYYVNVR